MQHAELLGPVFNDMLEGFDRFLVQPHLTLHLPNEVRSNPIIWFQLMGALQCFDSGGKTSCFAVGLAQAKPRHMVVNVCPERNLVCLNSRRVVAAELMRSYKRRNGMGLRRTYHLNSTDSLPCPSVDGQVSPRRLCLRSIFQAAFSLDSAARDNFDEVPLAFLREPFRQSARRFGFPWIEFERFLEAFRCSVGVWWRKILEVVNTQRGKSRREGGRSLECCDEVLVRFVTVCI